MNFLIKAGCDGFQALPNYPINGPDKAR